MQDNQVPLGTKINYVTGNKTKFAYAKEKLKEYGIELVQIKLDIPEIQSNEKFEIAIDKAKKAYDALKEPLFVTDAYWEIESLNGFPGAYMKYVNDWLTAEDFINLMKDHKNRKACVTDSIVYIDEKGIKKYFEIFTGEIANEKYSGKKKLKDSTGWDYVFMRNGKYLGEYHSDARKLKSDKDIWSEFSEFLKKENR
jgi:non-canonical purine NTP pyrophosphatase (RdgB/HAM1 family)